MKTHRVALVFLVLTVMTCGIVAGSTLALEEQTVTDTYTKDIRADSNNTTSSKTSLEDLVQGLFERIFGILGDILDFLVPSIFQETF